MKYLAIFLLFFGVNTWSAPIYKLTAESGETHFLAIGNPSAIRIEGKLQGPEGELLVQEIESNLMISGSLKVNLKNSTTGMALRDRHMKEKYLEVDKYAEAVLSLENLTLPKKRVSQEFPEKIKFNGVLSLHGVQKPIAGEFVIKPQGTKFKINANFPMKISEFGIQVPTFAGITVADHVDVTVQATAEIVK